MSGNGTSRVVSWPLGSSTTEYCEKIDGELDVQCRFLNENNQTTSPSVAYNLPQVEPYHLVRFHLRQVERPRLHTENRYQLVYECHQADNVFGIALDEWFGCPRSPCASYIIVSL